MNSKVGFQQSGSHGGSTQHGSNSLPTSALPLMSNFAFPQGSDSPGGQSSSMPQVYVDPETIKQQKEGSISMIDSQTKIAKDRAKAEYDSQVQAVNMRAEIENQNALSAIEQAKYQALFALDQQHQQRRLEIEQRSQEQKLQIEATASQLIMQAQQQRMQKEMEEKLAKLQSSMPSQMFSNGQPMFSTSNNLGGGGNPSFQSYQFYNPYSSSTTTSVPPSINMQAGKRN
jgi:hypothetical protein